MLMILRSRLCCHCVASLPATLAFDFLTIALACLTWYPWPLGTWVLALPKLVSEVTLRIVLNISFVVELLVRLQPDLTRDRTVGFEGELRPWKANLGESPPKIRRTWLVLTLRIARIRHVELVNGHFLLDGFEVRLAIALSGLLTPGLGSATI